jgi:transmembrane sensor
MKSVADFEAGRIVCLDADIVDRASQWLVKMWSGTATPEDHEACARWRAAHADHELAWQRLRALDQRLTDMPRDVAKRTLGAQRVSLKRRKAIRLLGALFATGATGYVVHRTPAWQRYSADHHTAIGERLGLDLPDSSRIVLGTASAMDLQFDERVRHVALRAGEILVTTAPDPAAQTRPFIVTTAQGSVRAIGTRFTVRQMRNDVTQVAVLEGAVMLQPGRFPARAVRIGAGQKAVFSNTEVRAPEATDETIAAWANGSLLVERMRLADFVEELARYRPGLLRCAPEVADYPLTGAYRLEDTDRILASVEQALPVKVMRRSRYWVTITAR